MYLTHVRHRVQEYHRWKAAFDKNAPLLDEHGALTTTIVQVNGDPNDVVVINTWPSKQHWDDFIAADQKKSKETGVNPGEEGGLIGQPEWYGGEIMA